MAARTVAGRRGRKCADKMAGPRRKQIRHHEPRLGVEGRPPGDGAIAAWRSKKTSGVLRSADRHPRLDRGLDLGSRAMTFFQPDIAKLSSGGDALLGGRRLAQNVAASPDRLDVVAAVGGHRQLLAQLADEDVDDLELGLVHAAIE